VQSREKLTAEITVRVEDGMKTFAKVRAEQLGMESSGEYIRHLLELDRQRAVTDLNLLAESLGLKVIRENAVAHE